MTGRNLRALATLLELRIVLATRIVASRGPLSRLINIATPLIGAWLCGLVFITFSRSASTLGPLPLVGFSMGVFAMTHVVLLFDILASTGRSEGMANALHHLPLSPTLLHIAETVVGLFSPLLLFIWTIFLSIAVQLHESFLLPGLWSVLALAYFASMRRLLLLLLASMLRNRWQRELVLALMSTAGLAIWLGLNVTVANWNFVNLLRWAAELPQAYWYTPLAWFTIPFCNYEAIGAGPRMVAWFGAPLQVAAVFVLGARAQRQACLGELETGGLLPGGHRRRRPARLWDRRPFVWIHPTVWATAIKEVKVVRRDPILVVMMVSQSVLLLLPPLLFLNISPRSGSVVGRAYLPLFLPLLLMAEHMPLFNQISLDGRGLRFLAQTPASRFQILVGKNLAYLCLFTGLNAAALGLAATLFSAWDQYLLYLGLSVAGLVVLMAVGNVVSVVLPVAWTGPRAAAGGARGAQAASEGGVERPGCLVTIARLFFLQVAVLLFLPVLYPILLLSVFAQPAALWAAALGALAYALLLYLLGTTVAARQLERNEDLLLERLAGRSAT